MVLIRQKHVEKLISVFDKSLSHVHNEIINIFK